MLNLLAVCWPGAQSASDDHILDCNFAKYMMAQKVALFFGTVQDRMKQISPKMF